MYAKRAAAKAVQHLREVNSYDASRLAVEAAMKSSTSMGRGSISDNSIAWPTAGRASVRAAPVAATLSGAPPPPVAINSVARSKYGGGQEEEEWRRVSVAA